MRVPKQNPQSRYLLEVSRMCLPWFSWPPALVYLPGIWPWRINQTKNVGVLVFKRFVVAGNDQCGDLLIRPGPIIIDRNGDFVLYCLESGFEERI